MAERMLAIECCPTCLAFQPSADQTHAIIAADRKLLAGLVAAELGDDWGKRVAKVFSDPRSRTEFSRIAAAINMILGERLIDTSEHHDARAWGHR